MDDYQCFVYHPNHEPIIVSNKEYPHYLANGWYDNPAKCPKNVALAEVAKPIEITEIAPVELAQKKKGRPPKAKAEEVKASV